MQTEVSLICTVKNEESSIEGLLQGLAAQTRPPDEVIIVDGGSTDRTPDIIRSHISRGAPFQLLVEKGVNIPRGRNIAIRAAKHGIIAVTDAGCAAESTWLERLIAPFDDDDVDVVGGMYRYFGDTPFEQAAARILSRKVPMMDEHILPSSRSVAFRRRAWEKVGGYPEELDFAEDTTFNYRLKAAGCVFRQADNAVVLARARDNAGSVFRQFHNYSKWDVIAGNANSQWRVAKACLFVLAAVTIVVAMVIAPLYATSIVALGLSYYILRYGVLMRIGSGVRRDVINGPLTVFSIMLGETTGTIAGLML